MSSRPPIPAPSRIAPALLLCAIALCVAGCQKPLLSPDLDRTQYDRYDTIRNQKADQFTMDEFGRRHPNLRARLLEKD
jgi:hypothetical protein